MVCCSGVSKEGDGVLCLLKFLPAADRGNGDGENVRLPPSNLAVLVGVSSSSSSLSRSSRTTDGFLTNWEVDRGFWLPLLKSLSLSDELGIYEA